MHLITVKPEQVFQALADRTRIRIMRLLVDTGEEICLCELVDSLQELQYKLSRHLKTLRQAGLLSAIKDGRWLVSGNRAAFLPTSSAGGDRIEADWPRSVASTALG